MLKGKRRAAMVSAVMLVALGVPLSAGPAQADPAPAAQGAGYRHGTVPTVGSPAAAKRLASANNLTYAGGNSGVGVTTGPPRVYAVFYGSQWGSQSIDAQGNVALSGDPKGMAPYLQALLRGLGAGSETWSGVMTQYCEGVATGAQTCPSSAAHVGYPTGGALAGVWVDTSVAAAGSPTATDLAGEAVNAANHFGNTTTAANRNNQYFIVSPTGTHPDGFNAGANFCAWHDFTADPTLPGGAVGGPAVAFTNMPYVSDAGSSCGMNFVNSAAPGTLDGVSIVGGHEYAETISDQFPAGGWTDSAGNENGDKCSWIRSGQGASQNISLTTGSFAMQSTWANDFGNGSGGCELSHGVVGNGANTVSVTNPGNQAATAGSPVSLAVSASDSGGSSLTFAATGLPSGLSIAAGSGLISGTPTTAGTSSVTVTATDTTGAGGSASFSWTIKQVASCTARQLLGNPGFETGSAAPWAATTGVISKAGSEAAHSGSWMARLNGYRTARTDTLAQTIAVPSGCAAYNFSFWRHIDTTRRTGRVNDTLTVAVLNSSGAVVQTLASYTNLNAANGFAQASFDLAAYAGKTITVKFTGVDTGGSATTNFVIDDTAFNVS